MENLLRTYRIRNKKATANNINLMIKLFRRKKNNIDLISIPDFGWKKQKNTTNLIQWINPEQTMSLSLNYFNLEPDLPSLKDINLVRDFYREQIVQYNGGLIQVDLLNIRDYKVIKTIFKIPQEPTGMVYLASLTIPFKNSSYVIKLQAPEVGTTGLRDSLIAGKLMQSGDIEIGENGFENWFSDPYNNEYSKGTLMNKSEELKYDNDFVEHPLSQARKIITEIINNIEFNNELEKLENYRK